MRTLLGLMLVLAAVPAAAQDDPFGSPMWEVLRGEYFGTAPVVFDGRVAVTAPASAENVFAVPVAVDARALEGVREIVLLADLNPFPLVLRYRPDAAAPFVATRFKVQQATAVRGAALTADGVWHVGGVMVDAAGGGCAAPAQSYAEKDWAEHVGEVQARAWPPGPAGTARVRLRIRHPQDTGLVAGIPAYFIEELTLTGDDGRVLGRLQTGEPVAENPVFTLELRPGAARSMRVRGRDNQAGEIDATIPLPRVGREG
ncbi:MAG TPA: quinoprotein dehydrogenase-associated SoxYZ-like carrier [Azospirillum sp.]|nr:quinoprotein dehydrogenase-associated SoxYZ-like carrier [Azospirillum sp.]